MCIIASFRGAWNVEKGALTHHAPRSSLHDASFPQPCEDLAHGHGETTAILELDQDAASQDFLCEHSSLSLGRHHPAADRRQLGLELLVHILLKAQATLQPAAAAGDLRRVERRFLDLG